MMAALFLQAAPVPPVPADWAALAPIPYITPPEMTVPLASFVAGEIAAGRCAVPKPADGHYVVRVEVATLVAGEGLVRRTVPRAIACPTVEQYAAGLVQGFARGNIAARAGAPDIWYRATVVFDWRG